MPPEPVLERPDVGRPYDDRLDQQTLSDVLAAGPQPFDPATDKDEGQLITTFVRAHVTRLQAIIADAYATISQLDALSGQLAGKVSSADLAAFARLDGAAFTGTVTVPTPADGDSSSKAASTAFVATLFGHLADNAPAALNTFVELANALGNDASYATTVTNALAGKLVKANNLSDLTDVPAARSNLGIPALLAGDLAPRGISTLDDQSRTASFGRYSSADPRAFLRASPNATGGLVFMAHDGTAVFSFTATTRTIHSTTGTALASFQDSGIAFTVALTVPTPAAADDSTKVATTAWVRAFVGAGAGGSSTTVTVVSAANAARGTTYTTTPAPVAAYPDSSGTLLTNGVIPSGGSGGYNSGGWVGWQNLSGNRDIVIDLGRSSEVYAVTERNLLDTTVGIYLPDGLRVDVSPDSATWTQLGVLTAPVAGANQNVVSTTVAGTARTGRFVRVRATSSHEFLFAGEIEVTAVPSVVGPGAGGSAAPVPRMVSLLSYGTEAQADWSAALASAQTDAGPNGVVWLRQNAAGDANYTFASLPAMTASIIGADEGVQITVPGLGGVSLLSWRLATPLRVRVTDRDNTAVLTASVGVPKHLIGLAQSDLSRSIGAMTLTGVDMTTLEKVRRNTGNASRAVGTAGLAARAATWAGGSFSGVSGALEAVVVSPAIGDYYSAALSGPAGGRPGVIIETADGGYVLVSTGEAGAATSGTNKLFIGRMSAAGVFSEDSGASLPSPAYSNGTGATAEYALRVVSKRYVEVSVNGWQAARIALTSDLTRIGWAFYYVGNTAAQSVLDVVRGVALRAHVADDLSIVVYGDSLMVEEGNNLGPVQALRDQLSPQLGIARLATLNYAVSGEKAADQKARALTNGAAGSRVAIWAVGTNDIQNQTSLSTFESDTRAAITRLQSDGARVVIEIPPMYISRTLTGTGFTTSNYDRGGAYRAALRRIAADMGCIVADATAAKGPMSVTNAALTTRDNIHSSVQGDLMRGQELARAILQAISTDLSGASAIPAAASAAGSSGTLVRTGTASGVLDTFTQADGTLSSTNWAAFAGSLPPVASNRVSLGSGGANILRLGLTALAGRVSAAMYGEGGVIYRQNDANNYMMVYQSGGALHRYSNVGGSVSDVTIASVTAPTSGAPQTIAVQFTGTTTTIYYGGTLIGTYNDPAALLAYNKLGFYIGAFSGASGLDDWTFTPNSITVSGLPSGAVLVAQDGTLSRTAVLAPGSLPSAFSAYSSAGQPLGAGFAEQGETWTYAGP